MRKIFFGNLNPRRISDNNSFWKNIQRYFCEKPKPFFTIFDEHLVSDELNIFVENATRGLEIIENSYIIDTDSNEINSVEKAINKYRNHSSVLLIKSTLKNIPSFSFNEVGLSEIERELNLINPRKATTSNGMSPQNLLKPSKANSIPIWVYIIIVITAIMHIAVLFLAVKKVSSENTEKRNSFLSILYSKTYLQGRHTYNNYNPLK